MKNHPEHTLFEPSGCLSREGLALFARGKLSAQELSVVKTHLQSCEFCTLAVEGIAMVNPDEFEGDLNSIFASLEEVDVITPDDELVPEFTEGFEGPRFPRLSDAEMKQFRDNMLKKAAENQEINKLPKTPKSIFRRYRLEMIAALVLLLLAIGARQIFVGISPKKQPMEIAQAPVESEAAVQPDDMPQKAVESESRALEMTENKPMPLQNVQKSKVEVDLEVSDDFIMENNPDATLKPEWEEKESGAKGEAIVEEENDHSEVFLNSLAIPYTPEISKTESSGESTKPDEAVYTRQDISKMEAKRSSMASEDAKKVEVMEEEVVESEIFTVVEQSPEFPGGETERIKFLQLNIKYPHEARIAAIQGTVYLTFVVEKDGNISDVRVLRGIGAGCDEEALRVIRLMPKWKPGKQRGKPVRVQMTIPIKFALVEKSK
jgi:TonB family protein